MRRLPGRQMSSLSRSSNSTQLGVEHFVFDLRTRFAEFEELIELIGSEVLPVLRRER